MPPFRNKEVIGLIPAAGLATRMGKLPCSKELLPFSYQLVSGDSCYQPKVAISNIIGKMRATQIQKVYIILRKGKWDIPGYLGDGTRFKMHFAYLIQRLTYGIPYTLDQAFPFVINSIVALGFPDTLYEPNNMYDRLLERLKDGDINVVLGLFPSDEPRNADAVEIDKEEIIQGIIAKPHFSNSRFVWASAVWTPKFTSFMHEYLLKLETSALHKNELQIGCVIQAAIEQGLRVAGVQVSEKPPVDLGTPEILASVVRNFSKKNSV